MKKSLLILSMMFMTSQAFAADITITVPDNKANKVYEAFDKAYNDPTENPSNSQKAAFVELKLIDHIKEVVYSYERISAAQVAADRITKDEGVAS